MRKLLTGLTLALTLGTATAIGTAASASADELSYLNAMSRLGITPTDGNYVTLLRLGYAICADKSMWVPLNTTVDNVAWNNNVTYTQAQAVVIAANTYLC
ncbi:hypothetical protein AU184_22690 [Mycolicibacterium novocastrense]|uniref:DUF732 domain-containing protein n=1 Tax=Mycolicibacterium novocastrense TaxID=59813 RepID=UPI00074A749A|nr:DUF732 domain-containing protein [Mycolicibacterium novocastrense]KUH67841.1 hypothetical protein AU072_24760 [Mycolicibacterium novocastrense]KUH68314.1 hypothetical protein AU184_22690 [Mycolicibacterium novocastrense]KUH73393.1 hypothetical protein AU183_23580 [Mycolicibacterium novocastrense]